MRSKTLAFAMTAVLTLSPMLFACASTQGGETPSSDEVQVEKAAPAPSLDGKWRQTGHAEGESAMTGAIDGDMIALWISNDGSDWMYWCGSFEAPSSGEAYTWVSNANKGLMDGLLSSQNDTKEFSYADGKLSFEFGILGDTTTIEMEQVSEEKELLAELKSEKAKAEAEAEERAAIQDLVLAESCYTITGNGYVHYTIGVNNPNADYAPKYVNVSVVGRAEDGTISFADDWTISTTLPGDTSYWANQAGNGNVKASDIIEIKLSVEDSDWYKTSQRYDFYRFDNLTTTQDSYGYPLTTGEITLTKDVDLEELGGVAKPMLVSILRDADHNLVGGYSTFVNSSLAIGEPTPFEIDSLFDYAEAGVEFASVEVSANPWL